jgi:hypothetical protein
LQQLEQRNAVVEQLQRRLRHAEACNAELHESFRNVRPQALLPCCCRRRLLSFLQASDHWALERQLRLRTQDDMDAKVAVPRAAAVFDPRAGVMFSVALAFCDDDKFTPDPPPPTHTHTRSHTCSLQLLYTREKYETDALARVVQTAVCERRGNQRAHQKFPSAAEHAAAGCKPELDRPLLRHHIPSSFNGNQ